MDKAKYNVTQELFEKIFPHIHHRHPTRFPRSNLKQPKLITKTTSFAISSSGSKIWKNYLHEYQKMILSLPLFLKTLKNHTRVKKVDHISELMFGIY